MAQSFGSAPDLTFDGSIGISPNPIVRGNEVTVSYTIKNIGNARAPASRTRIQVKPSSSNVAVSDVYQSTTAVAVGEIRPKTVKVPIGATIAAGSYTVYVILDADDNIGQSDASNASDQRSTALTVQAGSSAVTLTLYVHSGSASGPVLPGATVSVVDGAGKTASGQTGAEGYISITGSPGTWQFTASKSGYATTTWSQSTTSNVTRDAFLVANPPATVTLTLYVHSGSASGPVLPGASVSVVDGEGKTASGQTGSEGYISITGSPGTWQFAVSKSGYATTTWSQSTTSNVTRDAFVVANPSATVTLTLYVHSGSTSGPVLPGASVSVMDGEGKTASGQTGAEGYISITGSPGTWQFTASKSGYATTTWSQSTTSDVTKHAFLTEQIVPGVPVITSVNGGAPVIGSDAEQSFTILGSNFTATSKVNLYDLTTKKSYPDRKVDAGSRSSSSLTIRPVFGTPADDWSVEVVSAAGPSSQFGFSVVSPSATISVYEPAAAANWTSGDTRTVKWSMGGDAGSQVAYFVAEVWVAGANFATFSPVSSSTRSVNWTIPTGLISSQVQIRVKAYGAGGGLLFTGLGNTFNIVGPTVGQPMAKADANTSNPAWGQPVSFRGDQSRDSSGGTALTYLWNFAGLGTATSANPTFAFSGSGAPRTLGVNLTVTETSGKTASTTISFLVGSTTTLGTNVKSSFSSDPVNLATGNYTYEHVDLHLPGRGLPFEFKRFYNSQGRIELNSSLGPRWTHSYALRVVEGDEGRVTFIRGDGNTEAYEPKPNGSYQPEAGVHNLLVKNADDTFSLTSKERVRHDFDSEGRLAAITDRNGNAITLHYSVAGGLDTITDTVGRVITFTADASGRLTGLTDPLNHTVAFAYDGTGDLVASTDRRGKTTHFGYDGDHQITEASDPKGNKFVRNEYDAMSRVVKAQKDALDGATGFEYNFETRITTETDALGYKSYHRHDEKLRVVAVTDPLGETERYEYDADNNRTRVTDKLGGVTAYSYDLNGNVTTKVDAAGKKTTLTYDAGNNPTRRTDALGKSTVFSYEEKGYLTKTIDAVGAATLYTYDGHGQLTGTVDPLSRRTKREYDAEGNLSRVTDPLGNATESTYDAAGRRLTQKDALNQVTGFTFDEEGNLLTTVDPAAHTVTSTYDDNGNRVTVRDARGSETRFTYDVKDRLVKVQDALGNFTQHVYDALDRKICTSDPLLQTTSWTYDALGRVLEVKDARNNATAFGYDANGNQTSVTDALGRVRWVHYDALNRPIRAGDPLGNVTGTDYDALGRRARAVDANGHATAFAYDVLGRLVRVTDAAGGVIRFTYDKAGNRLTMTDPKGYTTRYSYDALNRRIELREPMGGVTGTRYDAVGNRIGIVDPKKQETDYSYDVMNRLTRIDYADSTAVTLSYDENGNRIGMTDGIGTSSWQYDGLNRVTSATDGFGKTIGYGYDAAGNRVTLTYPGDLVVHYTYDQVNRLVSVRDWLDHTITYTYDPVGNLTSTANPNGTTVDYGYDDANRLTHLDNLDPSQAVIASYDIKLDPVGNHREIEQQEPLEASPPEETVAYAYDKNHRLLKAGATAFAYDANGNTTTRGTDTFAFDARDRLAFTQIAGTASTYRYDGLGNRIERTAGSATTRYVLDLDGRLSRTLAETDGTGAITAYYVHGLGLVSRIATDGTPSYFHFDPRGSTVALSDAAGAVTDKFAYDTFGKVVGAAGTNANPFHYLGRHAVVDDSNGLLQVRARYYAPDVGRFVSKDPKGESDEQTQSFNRYIYSFNNPIIRIDPSGFYSWSTAGTGLLQVFAGVGSFASLTLDAYKDIAVTHEAGPGLAVDFVDTINDSSKQFSAAWQNFKGGSDAAFAEDFDSPIDKFYDAHPVVSAVHDSINFVSAVSDLKDFFHGDHILDIKEQLSYDSLPLQSKILIFEGLKSILNAPKSAEDTAKIIRHYMESVLQNNQAIIPEAIINDQKPQAEKKH